MALGRIMISMTPHTAMVTHWFVKKRGTALGLASAGIGFGSVLVIPSVQYALSRFGLRGGCEIAAGAIVFLLFPLNAWVPRLKPAEMGLQADGERAAGRMDGKGKEEGLGRAEASEARSWTVLEALKTPRYWLLYSAFFLGAMTTMVEMHELAYLVDAGFGKSQAAIIFACVSLVQSLGTFTGGALSDRIGRESSYTLGALCLIVGVSSLLTVRDSSPGVRLAVFVLCYGLGNGFNNALIPSITADVFHGNRVGSIYGTFATAITFGGGFSPWLAGYLFDRNGNYVLPFLIATACVASACLLVWVAAPRKSRLRKT